MIRLLGKFLYHIIVLCNKMMLDLNVGLLLRKKKFQRKKHIRDVIIERIVDIEDV